MIIIFFKKMFFERRLLIIFLIIFLVQPLLASAITTTDTGSTSVTASIPSSQTGISGGSSVPLSSEPTPQPKPDTTQPAKTTEEPSSPPPIISNVSVGISAHSALISWNTDKDGDSQIAYGVNTNLGTIVSNPKLTKSHVINLSGLIANKKYYFLIHSTDAEGGVGSGEITPFKTSKDTTAPANASQFNVVGENGKIILTWKKPSDTDYAGVLIKRALFAAPKDTSEGQTVYNSNGVSFTDIGLKNGTTYYYTAFTYDTSGNFASGVTGLATPSGVSGPASSSQTSSEESQTPASGGASSVTESTGQTGSGGSGITSPSGGGTSGGGFVTPELPSGLINSQELSQLSLSSISFYTAGESINIFPDSGSNVRILSGENLTIAISESLVKDFLNQQMIFEFNGDTYVMKKNDRTSKFYVTVQIPEVQQKLVGIIKVLQADESIILLSIGIKVERFGLIYTDGSRGNEPVVGAQIKLFVFNADGVWEEWGSQVYNQKNPQISGKSGAYGWVVPDGTYFYAIEKEGFRTFESNRVTLQSGGILNSSVRLLAVPPSLASAIKKGAPLRENIKNVASNLGKKTAYVSKIVTEEVEKFVENPEVQKATEQIAAPVVAGAAAANVSAAVGFGQLVPYLRFLFTQPLLVFSRRRRKAWGVVYNSLTKVPIALATIRLIDATTNRIVQSRVTDSEGRYAFFTKSGAYKILVNQNKFIFPSKFLADLKEDSQFIDLYHGEMVQVSAAGALVTANIPLDPSGVEKPIGQVLRQVVLRRIQHLMSVVSVVLSAVFMFIKPSFITGAIAVLQISFYFIFRRLALPRRPKSWGIIYDKQIKTPLSNTVARIFDKKFNKLLETQVTDKTGKYAFLVGKNEYYVVFERPGYAKRISDNIDLTKTPEPVSVVGFDIDLQRQQTKDDLDVKDGI